MASNTQQRKRKQIEAGLLDIATNPEAPAAARVSAWSMIARLHGVYEPDNQIQASQLTAPTFIIQPIRSPYEDSHE